MVSMSCYKRNLGARFGEAGIRGWREAHAMQVGRAGQDRVRGQGNKCGRRCTRGCVLWERYAEKTVRELI